MLKIWPNTTDATYGVPTYFFAYYFRAIMLKTILLIVRKLLAI